MKALSLKLGLLLLPCLFSHAALAELSLEDAIRAAVKHNPSLEADQYRELSHQQNERIAKADYYPRINIQAIEGTGFPGSFGALGLGGVIISPYAGGPRVGALLEQDIWDFGRTSGNVDIAEKETNLLKKETQVTSLKIGQVAQEAFFFCARDRSLAKVYLEMADESQAMLKEVENFVRVGQRSIVDKYLSESQTEEIRTFADDFNKRFQLDNERLAYLTGLKADRALCPLLENGLPHDKQPIVGGSTSPLITRAEALTLVSKAEKGRAEADFNPKLVGLAAVSWMDHTTIPSLIPVQYYAAGVGLTFPLFEGFRTKANVRKFELQIIQNEKNLDATRFAIDDQNLKFDQAIRSAEIRIDHLEDEQRLAQTGYKVAKKRYYDLQGTLLDLREALRNYLRTSSDLKAALYDLATQKTAKSLLNGQWNQILSTSITPVSQEGR